MIVDATHVEQRVELFRGLPEDRYVSAYLDQAPYNEPVWKGPDRLLDAIEVLRTSSLSTYENRRISTGALFLERLQPLSRAAGQSCKRVALLSGSDLYPQFFSSVR